jgi:secreted trypsin-like serine protease
MPGPSGGIILPTVSDYNPEPIIGGDRTSDFPDCCAVGNDGYFCCSGTLVAPNLVITAAHCVGMTRVFLGGDDTNRPEAGEIIRVSDEHRHERADIRVLVLERESEVTPRHVAQGDEVRGDSALVVGFGTVNLDGTIGYGIKRKVTVPILSLICAYPDDQDQYGCHRGDEMVAGQRGLLRDSCCGDSGGPLYIQGETGEYHLLGATSRGIRGGNRACGDGGVYVRVDQLLSWIRDRTGVTIEGPRL